MTSTCLQCGHTPMRTIHRYEDFVAQLRAASDVRPGMLAYLEANPDARFERILACDGCSVIRLDPMPTFAALGKFYTNYGGNVGYAKKKKSKMKRAQKRIAGLTKLLRNKTANKARFLDVGCNIGFAVEAARLAGFDATGIEIGAQAVVTAKELFPKARFFDTTIEDFATKGEQFDLVYCTEVIEHTTDVKSFVATLSKLVKPDGILFLTTPDAGHWRRPKNFLEWGEVKPPEHVSWQTRKSLSYIFTAHGFARPHFRFSLKPGHRMVVRKLAA